MRSIASNGDTIQGTFKIAVRYPCNQHDYEIRKPRDRWGDRGGRLETGHKHSHRQALLRCIVVTAGPEPCQVTLTASFVGAGNKSAVFSAATMAPKLSTDRDGARLRSWGPTIYYTEP